MKRDPRPRQGDIEESTEQDTRKDTDQTEDLTARKETARKQYRVRHKSSQDQQSESNHSLVEGQTDFFRVQTQRMYQERKITTKKSMLTCTPSDAVSWS